MSRYTKEHYEDVAKLLIDRRTSVDGPPEYMDGHNDAIWRLAGDFADLFAADNPRSTHCGYCGVPKGTPERTVYCHERGLAKEHSFSGFNREQFLAACGLEPEADMIPTDDAPEAVEPPHRYG